MSSNKLMDSPYLMAEQFNARELKSLGFFITTEDDYFEKCEDEFSYKGKLSVYDYDYDVVVVKSKALDDDIVFVKHYEINRMVEELPASISDSILELFNDKSKGRLAKGFFLTIITVVSIVLFFHCYKNAIFISEGAVLATKNEYIKYVIGAYTGLGGFLVFSYRLVKLICSGK